MGEADRILTLFTLEHGKLDGVAKGLRRARSRIGGRLEFGNEVAVTMHRGRSLDVISGVEILREHWSALVEPSRFAVAAMASEMIDAFCEPDLAMPDIYALLAGMLAAIARSAEPRMLLPRFSMRLLEALGIAPPLDRCVRCDNLLAREHAWLDGEAGGLVDDACRERGRLLPELAKEELANLRALAAPRSAEQRAVRALPSVARAVELLVAHHLGRRLKSVAAAGDLETKSPAEDIHAQVS